jgi:hypothetical protein
MKNGIYVIDRIEEGFMVLVPDEGGETANVPLSMLPDAIEGDAVEVSRGGKELRRVTAAERAPEKEINGARLHSLFKRGKNTD